MDRLGGAEQHGSDGDTIARRGFQQVEGDVGRVKVGHQQQIGFALQSRVGKDGLADGF